MMGTLAGNGIFLQGRTVFLPLEYERFGNIVQGLTCHGDVAVDVIEENFCICLADIVRNMHIGAYVGHKTTGIGMMAAVAAAGSCPECLDCTGIGR